MLNQLWICNECTLGKCFVQSEKSCISTNGHIAEICQHRFGNDAKYRPTTKHKITAVAAPIHYLNIQYPVDKNDITAAHLLADHNGTEVIIKDDDGISHAVMCDKSTIYFPRTWLKQVTEPTVEELQDRLDRISERVASDAISSEFAAYIIKMCRGEK